MTIYKVFKKNYKLKKGEFMGVLVERRSHARQLTQMESAVRWARLTFGRKVEDKNGIFVVPDEYSRGNESQALIEKLLFSKEELFEATKLVSQEMQKNREMD